MTEGELDLRLLLTPSSIAVVGASERPGPGRQVVENLRHLGFSGQVIAVNPKYVEVLGFPCFPSLSAAVDTGLEPDLVAVLLARDQVLPAVEEAARLGIRAGWALASGFAEADAKGRALQAELANLCREVGMAFMGPNCVGFLNPHARVGAYSAPVSPTLKPGPIGVVGQSGSVCLALANASRGLGFSLLVSSGDEAVVDATDFIAYMLEDPGTQVILAFVEQFRRPERFLEVARRARELPKPIVVLKVGRSEVARRAAATHTGAISGLDAVYDAVFEQYGVIRVDDLDEMLETAVALAALRGRLPRGKRVGMITLSGGEIGLVGDLAQGLDISFPPWSLETETQLRGALPPYAAVANPLDAWGSGKIEETYPRCVAAAAAEEGVDVVLISLDAPPELAPAQVDQYRVVVESAAGMAEKARKPVVVLSNLSGGVHSQLQEILERGRVPFIQGTREGLRAVHHLIHYGACLEASPREVRAVDRPEVGHLIEQRAGVLTEYESKQLLAACGIPCTRERLCRSPKEAVHAARTLGYPVALKVMSPTILHKTEAGLVRLGIRNRRALWEAYAELWERALQAVGEGQLQGVLVQEMVPQPVAEVIVGISRDPSFGPVVVFGMGGTLVELLEDRTLALPPLIPEQAAAMIAKTKASRLLSGFRGRPPGDQRALVHVLVRLGQLAYHWGQRILALDVNPLFVFPEGRGVVAVDALVELEGEEDRKERDEKSTSLWE